jgi:hypothetical protein
MDKILQNIAKRYLMRGRGKFQTVTSFYEISDR